MDNKNYLFFLHIISCVTEIYVTIGRHAEMISKYIILLKSEAEM